MSANVQPVCRSHKMKQTNPVKNFETSFTIFSIILLPSFLTKLKIMKNQRFLEQEFKAKMLQIGNKIKKISSTRKNILSNVQKSYLRLVLNRG